MYSNSTRDKMEEECGVFGIYSKNKNNVALMTYYGLFALQHRGQESAGISVCDNGEIITQKNMGLVASIFNDEMLKQMQGTSAIGHVRYSTCGGNRLENCQPLQNNFKLGSIAIAHNGNLTNANTIRDLLEDGGATFSTTIDSEVIIKLIARKSAKGFESAIRDSINAIKGAYALTILMENKLIGVRDPYGIRPLCLGKTEDGDYVLASESCALDAVGAEFIRDLEEGEMVIIDDDGVRSIRYTDNRRFSPCSFEYIYFARPDTTMDGIDVYSARVEAGKMLARQMKIDADIVIGVPDSGVPAAIGYAEESGIPYSNGLIKNKYIARTFIQPTQDMREKSVMAKLNPLKKVISGKRIVIVDDSLVRGTTSKILIEILRKAGAKEIHFRSASPPVKFPCFFGIDTADRGELIAANMSIEEIREYINADTLDYLYVENMLSTFSERCQHSCLACFNGDYPISTLND